MQKLQIHVSSPTSSEAPITKNRPNWEDEESDSEDDEILIRSGLFISPKNGSNGSGNNSTALSQSGSNASLVFSNNSVRLQVNPSSAAGTTSGNAASSISFTFPASSSADTGTLSSAASTTLNSPANHKNNLSSTTSKVLSARKLKEQENMNKANSRINRVAEGMLVIDSMQIEKLKLQFRDEETGKFDKALELREFVTAFASVLGKTSKEFKHMFMKIDANSDGSIDWEEFTTFLLMESGGSGDHETASQAEQNNVQFVRSKMGQTDFPPGKDEGTVAANKSGVAVSGSFNADGTRKKIPHTSSIHIPPAVGHSTRYIVPSKKSTFHTGMISKLLYLPSYDRYVTGGRDGLLKFWNASDLNHIKTIKHSSCWISDICWMKRSNRIVVCSMDRVITFYDPTTFECVSRIRDVGSSRPLSSAPTCMCSSVIHNGEEEILLIGDDTGNLLLYRMKHVNWHICDGRGGVSSCRHHEENTAKNYSEYVSVAKLLLLHDDWITSVKYDNRLGMVITSSLDRTIKQCDINKIEQAAGAGASSSSSSSGGGGGGSNPTGANTNANAGGANNTGGTGGGAATSDAAVGDNGQIDATFSLGFGMEDIVRRTFTGHKKGVYSFDYSKKYKFMASCGLERKILLWDPFTLQMITSLTGHMASIQQVLIVDEHSLLISLDFLKTIKVWNLKQDHHNNSLKNIQNIFHYNQNSMEMGSPSSGLSVGGGSTGAAGHYPGGKSRSHMMSIFGTKSAAVASSYRPENRISFMHFDSSHQRLLSCNARIHVYNLKTLRNHGPKSHKFPLVNSLYIANFNQVISADNKGTVNVWDVDTGMSVFKFCTGTRITAMCLDSGKRRLLTGSSDGSLKMWNFSNGQELISFENRHRIPRVMTQSANQRIEASTNEITAVEYLTLKKAHSMSKYVLSTALDRRVTVYLEGDDEKIDEALFVMPPPDLTPTGEPRVIPSPANSNANGRGKRSNQSSSQQSPNIQGASYSDTFQNGSSGSSHASAADQFGSVKADQGHKDDILAMTVCGKSHTIATGSYDGSICLWHFDSANFYAKLVPPPTSTNQWMRRAAAESANAANNNNNSHSNSSGHPLTDYTNPAAVQAIQNPNKKAHVSFAANNTVLSPLSSTNPPREKDGFHRYSPAANPWEELTPLIERAVEKLVWLDRQELLVSAGADGILRFWDVNYAMMVCDRMVRVGHTRSENILALKAVETLASNWEDRLALQQQMQAQGLSGSMSPSIVAGGISHVASSTNLTSPIGSPPGLSHTASMIGLGSGAQTPSLRAAEQAAVKAIEQIDSKPPVHYTFLITGDSEGHLIMFDISKLEVKFVKQPTPPSARSSMNIGKKGHSVSNVLGSPVFSALSPLPPPPRDLAVLTLPLNECILPAAHWQAHSSAIVSLDYLSSYKMVMSGGADGRILLWTRQGALVGMFGQSTSLDGCWDLHDPSTYKGVSELENRSLSDEEDDGDDEDEDDEAFESSDEDEEEKKKSPKEKEKALAEKKAAALAAAKRRSLVMGIESPSPEPQYKKVEKQRKLRARASLAQLYGELDYDLEYDESPPHTPVEDEGRTRSNTPDAEEVARAAAVAAKNRASTVDSLAALGMAANRDKENKRRRDVGLPSLEEEEEKQRVEKESKERDNQIEVAQMQARLSMPNSANPSPRGSVANLHQVLPFSTSNPQAQKNAFATPSIIPSTRNSMTMGLQISVTKPSPINPAASPMLASPQVPEQRQTLKQLLAIKRASSLAPTSSGAPGADSVSTTGNATGAASTTPSGRASPTTLGATGRGGIKLRDGTGNTPIGGSPVISGTSRTARRQMIAAQAASVAAAAAPVSTFASLLSSKEGFEYYKATIFNKPSSSSHPNNNAPPPRSSLELLGSQTGSLLGNLLTKEHQLSQQMESDEEKDDFFTNEGGHASNYFYASRGMGGTSGLSSVSGADSLRHKKEDIEARRNRLLFGALMRGKKLTHDFDDEDSDDDPLDNGLLRPDSASSHASLGGGGDHHHHGAGVGGVGGGAAGTASGAGGKKQPLQSQRMQGVSAANIRRRLASLHDRSTLDALSSSPSATSSSPGSSSTSSSSRHHHRRHAAAGGHSTSRETASGSRWGGGGDRYSGSHTARNAPRSKVPNAPTYFVPYPMVEVPFDTKGREDHVEEEFAR